MKLSVCVLSLCCLVLVAAIPAPGEEGLQGLLTELKDEVAGIEEQLEVAMEKQDLAEAEEDLLVKIEDFEPELKKRGTGGMRVKKFHSVGK
ncbi:Hypp8426 [Branchiostoma lanceolatum]|uniref:Hypp8426 protein n=1 Tax=Branchiostoma lanceolatum TaxID=7740 RepID=A0A8J9Z6S8_BRALA|nr:Hypp8426 [Branchiostoma lanceolatum]